MKKNSGIKKKVVVAMSGGVDSSVSAALLRRDGFDVAGVFMKCWSDEEERFGQCTAVEDEHIARQAAAHLNIPLYTFDFTKEYKERVADYFIREYAGGRTPNPDVMCNKEIKFGVFFKKAVEELRADYVAMGHYARLMRKSQIPNPKSQTNSKFQIPNSKLLVARDINKDQSYFLYRLGQEQLARTLFPIGEYTKPQVRELAKKFGLPNAERPDSQGICFMGMLKVEDFLRAYIPDTPGDIRNHKGERIGAHNGLHLYTIGQRKGIRVGGGLPYYVVAKDYRTNTLHVAFEHDEALKKNECMIEDVHWIEGEPPQMPLECEARIRYRQPLQRCCVEAQNYAERTQTDAESFSAKVRVTSSCVCVRFEEPQRAVTPGQSAVFYQGEECIGGGIIA